jgi:hypothetical protein
MVGEGITAPLSGEPHHRQQGDVIMKGLIFYLIFPVVMLLLMLLFILPGVAIRVNI